MLVFALIVASTNTFAESLHLPRSWPTALEKFVYHQHSQIVRVHETGTFGDSDELIRVAGIVARNTFTHPSQMRGLRIAIRAQETADNVYLPLPRANALRARISELRRVAEPAFDRVLGAESTLAAGEDATLAVTGTEDCRPGQPLPRMHTLCVGLYRRGSESGITVGAANASVFLANLELVDLQRAIDSALVAIEPP